MAAAAAALRHLALGARLAPHGRNAGAPLQRLQQRRGFRLSAPAAIQVAGRVVPGEGFAPLWEGSGPRAGGRGDFSGRAEVTAAGLWGACPRPARCRCLAGDGAGRAEPGAG